MLAPIEDLAERALGFALSHRISTYDAGYAVPRVTADERRARALSASPVRVLLLSLLPL